ncbi:MAG: hypothetical protein ABIH72_00035 [archaeon]
MDEDKLKEAFKKIKEDIFNLGSEITEIKQEISKLNSENHLLADILSELVAKIKTPTHSSPIPTTPTHIPTHQQSLEALESQNKGISTGNEGVPTDRQTNQQTDKYSEIPQISPQFTPQPSTNISPLEEPKIQVKSRDHLDKAAEILSSLDGLKKEIRLKIKRLTPQEMATFSLLYQLDEQIIEVDYTLLSKHLSLSESSIRDYIGKIQRKGIPIIKEKLNNKRIILHISPDLKKIVSLSTILQLREL